MRRLFQFGRHCLCRVSKLQLQSFFSEPKITDKVLGPRVQSLEETMNGNRPSWLRHILRMPTERILFFEIWSGWKMSVSGQSMICLEGTKTLTSGLTRVHSIRLPG